MYGRSIKTSGIFNNVDRDEDIPYNNDRLDDAVSLDYSQALSGAIRETSGTYASRIIRESSTRQPDDRETSGVYATRIGSSRQQPTSTPELPPRRHSNAGSGHYAQRIGNIRRSQSDRHDNKHENPSNLHGMDRLGNTVVPKVYENHQLSQDRHGKYRPPPIMEDDIGLQGLDSPRSTQWPETARSYPLGFEASHVASNVPYMETIGETSDDISHGKRKKRRDSSKRENRPYDRNSSDIQTPPWANKLLDKNSSLVGKFRNMREQINKWTLRRFSDRARVPYSEQGPFELIDLPTGITGSEASLIPRQTDKTNKTNNLALILFGLFLIFILVFPVIIIIVLFTGRSDDLVQIQLSIRLNGSVTESFNSGNVEYSICSQMDLAFSSYNGFYGCNVNEFRNGSIVADMSLLFRITNYPNNMLLLKKIEEQFTNNILHSVDLISYSFVQSSQVSVPSFLRQDVQTTPEVSSQTTMQMTTSTSLEQTTTQSLTTTTPFTTTSTESPTTATETIITTTKSPTTSTEPLTTSTESLTTSTKPITSTTEPLMPTTESFTTTAESITTTESPTTSTEPPTTSTKSPTTTTESLTTTTESLTTTTEPLTINPLTTSTELLTTSSESATTTTESIPSP